MRPKFLVVDDDPDNREVVSEALRYMGFTVDEAASAEEALARLQEAEFDVLITDVDMPGMGGLELVRLVRAQPGGPYAVVMSGRAVAHLAEAAGADDFLSKPFGLEALREKF